MLNKKIVIVIIITLGIYLLFAFKNYIIWFLKEVKYTFKKRKDINKLKKIDINKRFLNTEQIKKYIILSKKYLKSLNLSTNEQFKISKELERHLIYSRFSEKYLIELLNEIVKHINLDSSKIKLKVEYISSKSELEYAGIYRQSEDYKEICLNIKNDMTISTVVSILAHECTHYLLMSNNIKLEDKKENEYLTEITAILLGFEKYMLEGYKISNDIVYRGVGRLTIKKDRVGYLTSKDVEEVIKGKKKYN